MDIALRSEPRKCLLVSTFGTRIRRARETQGMTQSELADALGVRSHVMWRYEHDKSIPKAERLEAIAKLLGVSSAWLLLGETPTGEEAREDPPGLQQFMEITTDLTPDEIAQLRSARFKGIPTVKTYTFLLMAIRETL